MDAWGTPLFLARLIVARVLRNMGRQEIAESIFIEPSAGNGVFVAAMLEKGIQPGQIVAIEKEEALCQALSEGFPKVRAFAMDFLDYHGRDRKDSVVVIGNPPFSNGAGLYHLEHAKRMARRVAFLMHAAMLEPCNNRGAFRLGLKTVSPIYCRKFVPLTTEAAEKKQSGSRPTFCFEYELRPLFLGVPVIDWTLANQMDARDGK